MRRRPRTLRDLHASREGAASVEAAFVLPLLLLVILGAMEFGRLAWTQAALNFAVQEAARCASVRPDICGDPADTAAFAAEKSGALKVPASAFTVMSAPCGTRVLAQLDYRPASLGVFPVAPRLSAQVCRP